jgi:hypothetical protein
MKEGRGEWFEVERRRGSGREEELGTWMEYG